MTIEERVAKLEKQNAILKLAVALAVLGVGLYLAVGQAARASPPAAPAKARNVVVRANEFILEDAAGKPRARLLTRSNGPGLDILDENGKVRAVLGMVDSGPFLRLLSENGHAPVDLRVSPQPADRGADAPVLTLVNANHKGRAMLLVTHNGPELRLLDGYLNGYFKGFASLRPSKDGPGLNLLDENGKVIWSTPR